MIHPRIDLYILYLKDKPVLNPQRITRSSHHIWKPSHTLTSLQKEMLLEKQSLLIIWLSRLLEIDAWVSRSQAQYQTLLTQVLKLWRCNGSMSPEKKNISVSLVKVKGPNLETHQLAATIHASNPPQSPPSFGKVPPWLCRLCHLLTR